VSRRPCHPISPPIVGTYRGAAIGVERTPEFMQPDTTNYRLGFKTLALESAVLAS